MDPQVLQILLKENETIVSKVQTKLQLLRQELAQVRRQKQLISTSIFEVENPNYQVPASSSSISSSRNSGGRNGTAAHDESSLVHRTSGLHVTSDYYLLSNRFKIVDPGNENENDENDKNEMRKQQNQRNLLAQKISRSVRSAFPFPNDRIVWTVATEAILRRAVLEEISTARKSSSSSTNSPDPQTWTIQKEWTNIARKIAEINSSSIIQPHACRAHYFFLKHLEARRLMMIAEEENTTMENTNNGVKTEGAVGGDEDSALQKFILNAFGIVDENDEGEIDQSDQTAAAATPKQQQRRPLIVSMDQYGLFNSTQVPSAQQLHNLIKFEDEYLTKIAQKEANHNDEDEEDEDGNDDNNKLTPEQKKQIVQQLLSDCFDNNLVFYNRKDRQDEKSFKTLVQLLPIEKMILIAIARRALCGRNASFTKYLSPNELNIKLHQLARIPSHQTEEPLFERFRGGNFTIPTVVKAQVLSWELTRIRTSGGLRGKPPSLAQSIEHPAARSHEFQLLWKNLLIDDQNLAASPTSMMIAMNLFAMLFCTKSESSLLIPSLIKVDELFPEPELQIDQSSSSKNEEKNKKKNKNDDDDNDDERIILEKLRGRTKKIEQVQDFLSRRSLMLTRILSRYKIYRDKRHYSDEILIDGMKNAITERSLADLMLFVSEGMGILKLVNSNNKDDNNSDEDDELNDDDDVTVEKMSEDDVRRLYFNQPKRYYIPKLRGSRMVRQGDDDDGNDDKNEDEE